MNKYTFACDPVANPSSVYSDTTHEWSEDGASVFAINRNFARPEFSVKDNGDQLETITPNIHVSQTMLFNGNGTVAARTRNDRFHRRLDGDVFCCGYNFKAAMKAFFDMSGRQPVLQRRALGNWW
ncbi:hypothetical protein E4U38_008444 [Claviceps purpurea]|nr:hypothetical protein E4U38_008444 [Claviceps purpurea]KAG6195222.1 hypothetical protein E4U10_002087 [Claviceps purpurea]KAG6212407.1 hypothetical protein E4U50_001917 [Claviceps purpurea]